MSIINIMRKISDIQWEIPKSYRNDMRVPARVYATKQMLENIIADNSLKQLVNVASLPGIQTAAMVMPDVHEGYGFPIGGVAATKHPDGVISPGGIGYDINCGVRLLKSNQSVNDLLRYMMPLSKEIFRQVPCGVGKSGTIKLSRKEMDRVFRDGAKWGVEQGYGTDDDLINIESNGTIKNAEPDNVSEHARERGADQLGTMGAGNHFVEVDMVAKIFDEETAKAFGLFEGQIVILIHTGSRGLGHQVATDYLRKMLNALSKYKISLPDRELACVPFSAPEGQEYFSAMACAANFAFCNRQLITSEVRNAWNNIFGKGMGNLNVLYDVAHNIAKVEEHIIDGKKQKVIVHRKGATRAFGPGHNELPEKYKQTGQPVIIPGSMGTASYVLAGTNKSMEESFGSTCHGAGRQMSRHAARKQVNADKLRNELLEQGIIIQAGSMRGIAEEGPNAYKDVHSVVDIVDRAGIAKKAAELKPLAVIKG